MKGIITIVMLICIASLFAVTVTASTFIIINPSNNATALGDITGVADPWRNDAFASWSNPALASFHDGIQIGYTSHLLYPEFFKTCITSSYLSVGYKGLGLTLPVLISNRDYGTKMFYPYTPMDIRNSLDSYETASEYGISYNLLHHLNAVLAEQLLDRSVDLSIGISSVHIKSEFYFPAENPSNYLHYRYHSDITNLGMLALYKQKNMEKLRKGDLQVSLGLKLLNLDTKSVQLTENGYSDPLPSGVYLGAGIFYGLPYEQHPFFSKNMLDAKYTWTTKFLVGRTTLGTIPNVSAYGLELGLQDFLYGRLSYKDSVQEDETGYSGGLGLRLHYKKRLEGSMNYSWLWAGDYLDYQKAFDFTVAYRFE